MSPGEPGAHSALLRAMTILRFIALALVTGTVGLRGHVGPPSPTTQVGGSLSAGLSYTRPGQVGLSRGGGDLGHFKSSSSNDLEAVLCLHTSAKTFALPHPYFWGFLYQPTSFYAYTSSFAPFRARRGRDEDHQGLRVHPSFPAMAGGPLSEDTTSLWGNPHRPQMAPDSRPLPQAVGAGAGAGLGGGWRWRDGWRGAGVREYTGVAVGEGIGDGMALAWMLRV